MPKAGGRGTRELNVIDFTGSGERKVIQRRKVGVRRKNTRQYIGPQKKTSNLAMGDYPVTGLNQKTQDKNRQHTGSPTLGGLEEIGNAVTNRPDKKRRMVRKREGPEWELVTPNILLAAEKCVSKKVVLIGPGGSEKIRKGFGDSKEVPFVTSSFRQS